MHVRGKTTLRLDRREILHVVAEVAAQVLNEPIKQRREMQRVPGGPLVVVAVRVGRGAVLQHLAVAIAGQGQEHGRPVGLAVRRGVDLPGRARIDLAPGQVRGVLAAARGPVTARALLAGVGLAADPGLG